MKQLYLVERDADAANIHFQVVWLQTILSEASISDMQIHAYILHIASQQIGIHGRDSKRSQLVINFLVINFAHINFFPCAGKLTHPASSFHQYAIWQALAVFINASFQREKSSALLTTLLCSMFIMPALPLFMPELK